MTSPYPPPRTGSEPLPLAVVFHFWACLAFAVGLVWWLA